LGELTRGRGLRHEGEGAATAPAQQESQCQLHDGALHNEAMRVPSKHAAAHRGARAGWGIELRAIDGFEQPELWWRH
jgi:hypothetical protein